MTANDHKPAFRGKDRFPEDKGDVKNIGGDPLDDTLRDDADPDADDGDNEDAEDANEGEGNKSADRRYRAGVARTVESGQVGRKAKEAEQALAGKEGDELRRAEEQGRRHSHGEDPALRKK